jgi:hypothetical protein
MTTTSAASFQIKTTLSRAHFLEPEELRECCIVIS